LFGSSGAWVITFGGCLLVVFRFALGWLEVPAL
jgi:hypothetical protein